MHVGVRAATARTNICELLSEELESSSELLSVGGKHIHGFEDFGKGGPSRAGGLVSRPIFL